MTRLARGESPKRMRLTRSVRRSIVGYLFLLPELMLFGVFLILPVMCGLFLNFYNYKVQGSTFIGLDNSDWSSLTTSSSSSCGTPFCIQ